ncbi:ADP-ribosylation factor-like protein 15 isoform 1-T1 [Alca torda]
MDYLCFRALCCKGPPPPRPEYDLVCIGLTGSGKTSLLSKLCSESTENIVSTTGFSIKAVPFQNAILNVKELGGADNIRKYWSRYYQGSQGVIFVLDSASSEDDLETARNELHSALQHPQLCTLPFLILANHQDKPAARSVQEKSFKGLFLLKIICEISCLFCELCFLLQQSENCFSTLLCCCSVFKLFAFLDAILCLKYDLSEECQFNSMQNLLICRITGIHTV